METLLLAHLSHKDHRNVSERVMNTKKNSFAAIIAEDIDLVMKGLNNHLRKCLGAQSTPDVDSGK